MGKKKEKCEKTKQKKEVRNENSINNEYTHGNCNQEWIVINQWLGSNTKRNDIVVSMVKLNR